jgi:hypothetical protein
LSERHGNVVAEGERDSDRLASETGGLPEAQPGEPQPAEDDPPREGAKAPRRHDDKVDETDHGKATGNPHDHD